MIFIMANKGSKPDTKKRGAIICLKGAGLTFEEIGKIFSMSRQCAHKMYWKGINAPEQKTKA